MWHSRDAAPTNLAEAAEVGRSAIRDLLLSDDPPTAVVAVNDMTALGVFGGIREMGLRVGDDVSVVGFDDIVLAHVSDPPLTTIRQPLAELAQVAIREALAETSEKVTPGPSILLRPELVVRESARPLISPDGPAQSIVEPNEINLKNRPPRFAPNHSRVFGDGQPVSDSGLIRG